MYLDLIKRRCSRKTVETEVGLDGCSDDDDEDNATNNNSYAHDISFYYNVRVNENDVCRGVCLSKSLLGHSWRNQWAFKNSPTVDQV